MNILKHEYLSSVKERMSFGQNPSNGIISLKYITIFIALESGMFVAFQNTFFQLQYLPGINYSDTISLYPHPRGTW